MILRPKNLDDLRLQLAAAHEQSARITAIEYAGFDRLIEHTPEDMTATVEAGMRLATLQEQLRRHNQWLPVDPPNPDQLTIGSLIARNAHGPRRFGHGTIRDYLIGITVVLADGRVVKSGGKVVKNVAGYDLCKLFVGNRDTLGVIATATFKLKPVPQFERFFQKRLRSLDEADVWIESVLNSDLTPAVLDLHNLALDSASAFSDAVHLVLGVSGSQEEVDYQSEVAQRLGISEPGSLDHNEWFKDPPQSLRCASLPPSELTRFIRQLGPVPWLARAGNGLLWYPDVRQPPQHPLPRSLIERVKQAFDPKQILPDLPL